MSESTNNLGEVPAGGEGADSGSVDATRISPDETAAVQNRSSGRNAPGIGPRRGAGATVQNEPAMDQHPATAGEKLRGIVVQTRADLPGATEERIADVVVLRLTEAGIDVTAAEVRAAVHPDAEES